MALVAQKSRSSDRPHEPSSHHAVPPSLTQSTTGVVMNSAFHEPVSQSHRAIVIGASMAGLLAARILSERYAQVLVFERDELPDRPAPRKGTPHATHAHGLLARGREVLEELFPGYTQALQARGAVVGDIHRDIAFGANTRRFAAGASGHIGVCCSRLLIEHELRQRVRALPNVVFFTNADVIEPIYEPAYRRVAGINVQLRRPSSRAEVSSATAQAQNRSREEQRFAADLVVDATGRGSRAPAWLRSWGFEAPEEERVTVGFGYITAYYERRLDHTNLSGVLCAASSELPCPGALLAQEPWEATQARDSPEEPRWVVTFGSYAGERLEASAQGMRKRALQLGMPEITRVTHEAKLLGPITRYGFPYSQRRHYERLKQFPSGFLVMGDALASFNPVYGQGMTVAACEALALRRALNGPHLSRSFFKAAAKVIDTPWQIAVGADLAIASVQGERSASVRFVNTYLARVFRAAEHDACVAGAFLKVTHMLASPASLFHPMIAARVAWYGRQRQPSIIPRQRVDASSSWVEESA
jgi:2-polyprenyl-6-methoxyphenol hydroxylase-like FAD-dependent oxidoreductase